MGTNLLPMLEFSELECWASWSRLFIGLGELEVQPLRVIPEECFLLRRALVSTALGGL